MKCPLCNFPYKYQFNRYWNSGYKERRIKIPSHNFFCQKIITNYGYYEKGILKVTNKGKEKYKKHEYKTL